jgi:pyruvate kinase
MAHAKNRVSALILFGRLKPKLARRAVFLPDLQGPKFRVGKVADETIVKNGDRITFDLNTDMGNASIVGLPHAGNFQRRCIRVPDY